MTTNEHVTENERGPEEPVDGSARTVVEETLEKLTEAFHRRRKVVIGVFLTTFLVVHAVAFFWPGKYAARAALLIQHNRSETQLNTNPEDPPTVVSAGVTEEQVNSEIAILRSHEVIEATVRSTGLDTAVPPWYVRVIFAPLRAYEWLYAWQHDLPYQTQADRAPEGLQRAITAERLKDSDVLVVEYRAGDPRFAEIVLGEVIRHFLDAHLAVRTALQAEPFFGSQADVLKVELDQYEDRLHELQTEVGAADAEAEAEVQLSIDGGLREESSVLARRVAELGARITEYDRIMEEATISDAALAVAPQRESILDDLKAQLLRLELERIDLESRYADDFPLVVENARKLEVTRTTLEQERANVREHSPTLAQIDLERARAVAERAGLIERLKIVRQQAGESRERLMALEQAGTKIERMEWVIDTVEDRYRSYLTRMEQARVDAELDRRHVTNVAVIQNPVASLKPVRPKKTIVLLTSLLGGLVMGLLAGVVLEVREVGLAKVLAGLAASERAT